MIVTIVSKPQWEISVNAQAANSITSPVPQNIHPEQVTVLERGRADGNYIRDLWLYRELFTMLAWRDLSIRYKQSVVGVGWALIRPLLTMVIFTWVFGRMAGMPSVGQVPYSLMVLAGILPWTLFSTAIGEASQSLVGNANLIQKVYFPRIITPIASCSVTVVDLAISLLLMFALMIYYGFSPDVHIVALPFFVLFAYLSSVGPALLLCSLTVRYRDFRFIVPFVVQFGLYVSPVGYASGVVAPKWQLLYNLNPIVAVIDGFRWSLLAGRTPLNFGGLGVGVAVTLFFLFVGVTSFRRAERSFADII